MAYDSFEFEAYIEAQEDDRREYEPEALDELLEEEGF